MLHGPLVPACLEVVDPTITQPSSVDGADKGAQASAKITGRQNGARIGSSDSDSACCLLGLNSQPAAALQ
jgi:hypothetical protein